MHTALIDARANVADAELQRVGYFQLGRTFHQILLALGMQLVRTNGIDEVHANPPTTPVPAGMPEAAGNGER